MSPALIEERAQIVARLYPLWLARQAKNEASRADAADTAVVKQWLGLEGERSIEDGEHGIVASLRPRKVTSWDTRKMPDELVLFLRDNGLLTVVTGAFDAARKAAPATLLDEANRYRLEGEEWSLMVEKRDA